MRPLLFSISIATSAVLLASVALSAGMLTDPKGMTLYIFDKDAKNKSNCYDACAANWPPYLVNEGKENGEGWTVAKRKDGSMQWVYDGKPLYYFHDDKKPGDANGEGLNGIWHTVKE